MSDADAADLDATLAQDPIAVAARVVRDLWTLARMAIDEGREDDATRWNMAHGQASALLRSMRERAARAAIL